MRSITECSGVASSLGYEKVGAAKFLSLALTLIFASMTVACVGVSQSSLSHSNQLSVSIPAQTAQVGVSYNTVASVSGGSTPYSFHPEGNVPPGIKVNPISGSITGIPTVAGTYNFTLLVADPNQNRGSGTVHMVVANSSGQGPAIVVSPGSATLTSRGVQQFTASVTGTSNTAVTWSASAGTISSSGKFTAPAVTANTSVTVTATSTADSTVKSTAAVAVTPAAQLSIAKSTLAEVNTGTPYSATLSATGGITPYQWSVATGSLPSGIKLQASTGTLAGTTSMTGSFPFTAKVTDSTGNSSTQSFTLSVAISSASGFDGPAELPRVYLQTAMANTPAPGTTTVVKAGGDLQSALNSANCGDTISLQAGATFAGIFTFPAKSCDDNHWIIVRTSASDSVLPAEGSRLTPCYAGVSSLPGRPALHCTSTVNVTAKILMPATGTGPIVFASGANHYRLIGLEVTRTVGAGIVYFLSSIAPGGTASNLILDRVWMHGTTHDDTDKGVELGGSSNVSVVDSFFTDFHCASVSGSCTDASAVSGGSSNPVGPYKIAGNFLEGSGENILFGGAKSATTPADIEISHNHFFKPLTWMRGQPGYVGGIGGYPFVVKNFIELKNAQRVLIEANIMENTWGGFSQDGYAIVLTPKNQAMTGSGNNLCPNCLVTDVTVRYNTASHVGAGLQIANALSDNGGAAADGERYSIHDLIVDDINPILFSGNGHFAEIMTAVGAPLLQNVSINHVTAFPPSGLFSIGGNVLGPKMTNFTFNNSLVTSGAYPVWSIGGGVGNCAYYDKPKITFDACFSPYSVTTNALIASPPSFPPSSWPAGNDFPGRIASVQFVNYHNGNGGDYHLLASSPYKNAGSDGKDLGADVDTILSETAGVY